MYFKEDENINADKTVAAEMQMTSAMSPMWLTTPVILPTVYIDLCCIICNVCPLDIKSL